MDTNLLKNNEIGEEQLEEVTGGSSHPQDPRGKCFFEPASPVRSESRQGEVWAQCKSNCFTISIGFGSEFLYCVCHGTPRCVNRMHKMEHVYGRLHYGYPRNLYNHSETRKAVHI